MTLIRVNSNTLNQTAGSVAQVSGGVRKLGDDVWRSASSAPSYQGQFGPKVRAIGQSALSQAQKHTNRMNQLSGSLCTRAAAFLKADTTKFKSTIPEGYQSSIFDTNKIKLLAALMGLPVELIIRMLRYGALLFPSMPWNPKPAYAMWSGGEVLGISTRRSVFDLIWCWIAEKWNELFGNKDSDQNNSTNSNDFTENINQTEPEPQKIANIGLNQNDYTDKMGEDGSAINDAGCLITCVAMIARYHGADQSPRDINKYLQENGGYKKNSSEMYWAVAEKYLESVTGKSFKNYSISSSEISTSILNGNPVIIHVAVNHNNNNNGYGHWVLATGVDNKGNYTVYESGTGKQSSYPPSSLMTGHKVFTSGK